jgi:restriction system protein
MVPDWFWLLLIIPISILLAFLRSAWFKGNAGELEVNDGLNRLLDPCIYHMVENVTLPFGSGTTQIDHLIVSPYGIFVVETKNMTGWIFGQPDQAQWTQVIYQRKERFQNPLLQNGTHVAAVRKLFGLSLSQVHNAVVFVGDCTFKTPMPDEVVHGVVDLADYIHSNRVVWFTEDEVHQLVDEILLKRLEPGWRTARTHVRNVNKSKSKKTVGTSNACPRCGGAMVERVNRLSGERFLGCQRYPQCKGTHLLP